MSERNILEPLNILIDTQVFNHTTPQIDSPELYPNAQIAKSYKVQENINNNFGGYQTNYETSNPDVINMNDLGEGNTRRITPVYQDGGLPISSNCVYDYPEQNVIVPTDGNITMKNVDYPIYGISQETGEQQIMYPGQEYFFKDTKNVLEIPKIKSNRFKR